MPSIPRFIARFVLACAAVASMAAAEVVIVHPDNPITAIAKDELENLLLGRSGTIGGQRAVLAVYETGAVHEAFLRAYAGRNPGQFTAYWRKLVFTGKGKQPTTIADEAAMVAWIKANRDGIGYISDQTAHDGVKVVPVQ